MGKFKYKFKAIKEIKERLEKKTQKELALVDMDIANKNKAAFELIEQLKEYKRKKLEKNKKVTELHFYEKYESYLTEQIGLIRHYISQKKIERDEKLIELVQKSKETKTFEKLEESHLMEFVKSQDKLEQKEMDEFAVNEFLKE